MIPLEVFQIFFALYTIPLVFRSNQYSIMAQEADIHFTRKTNDFALELYKQISSDADKNIVISPFSISTCLSLAAMGARGLTAEEMLTVLKYDPAKKDSVADCYGKVLSSLDGNKSLKVANKMYIMENYSIKTSFNEIAKHNFYSEAQSMNFQENNVAAEKINSWVEQKTNNKIKNLISPDSLDEMTRLVLVNAIYFKGTWTHQFNAENSKPMPFWINTSESIDVLTMNTKKHFKYGLFDDHNLAALELTYSDSDVSMLILLPHERDGLSTIEKNLQNIDITDMLTKMYSQEVEVFLPKFKIEFSLDLKDTLEKLGMGTMFSDNADFSELLEQKEDLKVSKVVHKAFIEVNEEGAEAAAATGVTVRMKRCAPIAPVLFNADHSFLFMLRYRNMCLLVGKYHSPEKTMILSHDEL